MYTDVIVNARKKIMSTTALSPAYTWHDFIIQEKKKDYFKNIEAFLTKEREENKTIYPSKAHIFNAFELTPYSQTRVVIIGQDPYHGEHQAMGLCFSVKKGLPLPPSLKNIYKELESDLTLSPASHGDLTHWAKQGVLLLNTTLTVQAHKAHSHAKIGWETFTDAAIKTLNQLETPIIYLLWGAFAQKKSALIDSSKHHLLTTSHPSPLSAYRGFLGSKIFSLTNNLLIEQGKAPIDWQIK